MALKKDAKRKKGNEERREDLFAFKTPNICQAFHTLFSLLTPLALSSFTHLWVSDTVVIVSLIYVRNIKIKCLTKRADRS